MSTSEAHIVEKVLDPEQWVDAYGDYLYRYAVTRLRDAHEAEEVVQETFLAGIHHRDQFTAKGSQRGWLVTILKRKIVDHVRTRLKHEMRYPREGDNDPSKLLFDEYGRWKKGLLPKISPDQQMESRELWQIIERCLQYLPQGEADVFVLCVMEDMKGEEICKELDITPSNLWVRMHRARLGLAKCVGAKWYPESTEGDSL